MQQPEECTLETFALLTQLPLDFLEQAGIAEAYVSGRRVLRVVCRSQDGGPGPVVFQIALAGEERYQWRRGDRPTPYGCEMLQKAHDQGRIALVRHLSDALVLRRIGIPALALLDADRALDGLTAPLRGLAVIYVLAAETDRPAVSRWIARSGLAGAARFVTADGLSDTYRAAPEALTHAVNVALENAVSWERSDAARRAEEKERAWAECKSLARGGGILEEFAEDLRRSGFAGDPRPAQTLFLCMTSRLLDLPTSLALKGPSAGGKSFILKAVLPYFPPRTYHEISSLSPKALIYLDAPLAHRMLVVAEYDGIEEKSTEYILRTLLSEGRISYDAPANVGGQWVTQHRVVEGPTGLVLTTTRLRLHPENETRIHALEINDTAGQTRAIMQAQAAGAQSGAGHSEPDYGRWHALQIWLEHGDQVVAIPFAEHLAARMPAYSAVRLRRDFPRVLQMIKAHALLQQASRERDAANRIVAVPQDYAVVYDLMAAHIAVEVEAAVSPEVQETVEAALELSRGNSAVTITALAARLGLDKSSVSRRVAQATQARFLRNRETRKGLPARLVIGEELPGAQGVLPHPDGIETAA